MSHTEKISPSLRIRLEQLAPARKIQILVMLADETAPPEVPLTDAREVMLADMRQQTQAALSAVDTILAQTGGHRLSSQADALGFLAVETNAAGIQALAQSAQVRALLENQDIHKI